VKQNVLRCFISQSVPKGDTASHYIHKLLQKVKVKLSLGLTKHHAMKTYGGSGGIAPRILKVGTRWRRVFSFTALSLPLRGKRPRYHCAGDWVGPRAGLKLWLLLPRNELRSSRPQPSYYADLATPTPKFFLSGIEREFALKLNWKTIRHYAFLFPGKLPKLFRLRPTGMRTTVWEFACLVEWLRRG